jgi:predicted metal-dependent hydrolase
MTAASIASGLKVEQWRGRAEFKDHARAWADRIGVKPARIQVQAMKGKWASCSTSGAISFSADLLVERRAFGEAVIVHELLHLKVRNHGPVFRSLVRAFLPGHEDLSAVTCERSRPPRQRIGAGTS